MLAIFCIGNTQNMNNNKTQSKRKCCECYSLNRIGLSTIQVKIQVRLELSMSLKGKQNTQTLMNGKTKNASEVRDEPNTHIEVQRDGSERNFNVWNFLYIDHWVKYHTISIFPCTFLDYNNLITLKHWTFCVVWLSARLGKCSWFMFQHFTN